MAGLGVGSVECSLAFAAVGLKSNPLLMSGIPVGKSTDVVAQSEYNAHLLLFVSLYFNMSYPQHLGFGWSVFGPYSGTVSAVVQPLIPRESVRCGDTDDGAEDQDDGGLALQEAKPKLKRPPLYKVVILNDDYTPMEFVVEILETFFQLNREKATQVMLHVHTKGKGVCGVFTREIAETKVAQVNEYSRHNQHPLMCDMEQN